MRSPVLLGVLVAVLIVAAAGTWWLVQKEKVVVDTPVMESKMLPRDSGAMLLLKTRDGQLVTVPDFTYGHPSVEVEDTGITYVYVTQDDTLTEADPAYGIVYGSDSSITIGLLTAPLKESRQRAELKLRELLPVPDVVLCALPIKVVAADTMGTMYGGKNLGLSFCNGSTAL